MKSSESSVGEGDLASGEPKHEEIALAAMLTGLRPDDTEGVELREASQLSRLLRLPSKGLRPPSGVAGFPILRRGETLGGNLRGAFAFSGTARLVSAEW